MKIMGVGAIAVLLLFLKFLSFTPEPDWPWLFPSACYKLPVLNKLPPSSYLFFKITLEELRRKY